LSANLAIDPMLGSTGQPLDPDVLLTGPAGKTRVSILSLTGLPSLEQQQRFIGQLAMILFSWIKKNPKPADVPLRGLLVIDEARDFVPSGKGSPCLASVQRLAAQARKYGFGVVFANQDPKGIDNKIVANCSTQWLGKMNSPAAIDTAVELLRGRGCNSGDDVGSLKTGRFYVSNADHLMPPTKLATPMCLSAHGGPLTPEAVMEKAAASRIAIRA
jgi:DNA helicase HerA-like ATPase